MASDDATNIVADAVGDLSLKGDPNQSEAKVPTADDVRAFLQSLIDLMKREFETEMETTSLLLSKCSTRLLEKKGLALSNLSVSKVNVGVGGKTLTEFYRPLAYNMTPEIPPHTFRVGDMARVETAIQEESSKATKTSAQGRPDLEGIIAKVSEKTITVSFSWDKEDVELPERCRLVKVANSATYKRIEGCLQKMIRSTESLFEGVKKIGFSEAQSVGSCTNEQSPADLDTTNDTSKSKNKPIVLNSRLFKVLFGLQAPSLTPELETTEFLNPDLNNSQKESVRRALNEDELFLLHGPPGTGKTHTLVEIIRQLAVNRNYRVLVCAASNMAVDNLLERLRKHDVPVCRVGHPARTSALSAKCTLDNQLCDSDQGSLIKDVRQEISALMEKLLYSKKLRGMEKRRGWQDVKALRAEYRKREAKALSEVLDKAQVILCTCHGSGSWQLRSQKFDYLIVDEACQAIEPSIYIPLVQSSDTIKKLILAGDPNQLPATVLSSTGKVVKKIAQARSSKLRLVHDLSQTLFDRLTSMWGTSIKSLLVVQYRMHEKIMEFPTQFFYEGKLEADETVRYRQLNNLDGVDCQDDEFEPVEFIDTSLAQYWERDGSGSTDDSSKYNENEGELVHLKVESLVSRGVQIGDICILSPYSAQIGFLKDRLTKFEGLQIGSIDSMQGREAEAVIISLVRSNEKREVGFLKESRRLNVAMTRAKRHLCVIGDSTTLKAGSKFLHAWMIWLETHADVVLAEELIN